MQRDCKPMVQRRHGHDIVCWFKYNELIVVKKAMELHKKLEYVNEHQKCELKHYQGQLEKCRRELLEARVKANSDREDLQSRGKMKSDSQELRLV